MPVGRPPTHITDEFMETLRSALASRNTMETSAALSGVNRSTLYRWTRRGRELAEARAEGRKLGKLSAHDRRCEELWDMVTRAVAQAEAETTPS